MKRMTWLCGLLALALLLSLTACKKKDDDLPVDAQPSQPEGSSDSTGPSTLPGAQGEELPIYDQQLIATYYDYFAQNGAMLNPIFAYPGESAVDDQRNLFVFGLRMAQYGSTQKDSVPKAVFDSFLLLHFDRTIDAYDASEGRIDGDKVLAGGFEVGGGNRFVLTELTQGKDSSLTGTFRVYHLPEGAKVDEKQLREGYIGAYEQYYSCTATIRFTELEDKESRNLRFLSIALED